MTSQEDDATELQFPKDAFAVPGYDYESAYEERGFCDFCNGNFGSFYIECNICKINSIRYGDRCLRLCKFCFTQGLEYNDHESNHDYVIVQNNFPLLESNWGADEELQLLNGISECGLGNWVDISDRITDKSAKECKRHYFQIYVTHPTVELDILPDPILNEVINIPYPVPHIMGTENPVRPVPGTSYYRDMCGYNAARGDFIVEHQDDAEDILNDIDFHDQPNDSEKDLLDSLRFALLDIYQSKVIERGDRISIIKEHALINMPKANATLNYYKGRFGEFSNIVPKLYPHLTDNEFFNLAEGLSHESELKQQIQELKEYRCNGLSKNSHISIYNNMKQRREINYRKKRKIVINVDGDEINLDDLAKLCLVNSSLPSTLSRLSVPLNITGEPHYENLNDEEKALASRLRLLPKSFNQMKSIMIDQCLKSNGLSLRQVRLLFKIDVNKIRKVYDFFIKQGVIYTHANI